MLIIVRIYLKKSVILGDEIRAEKFVRRSFSMIFGPKMISS